MDEPARQAHIAGVKANLRMAHAAAQALGDIPPVLAAPNFLEHGPDEKSVIIFVAFLCARVLEVSKEDRAAQVIQHFFRCKRSWQPGGAFCHSLPTQCLPCCRKGHISVAVVLDCK